MSPGCDENTETNQDVIMIEKKEIQISYVILKTLLYNNKLLLHAWKWVDCRKNDIKCSCQTSKIVMLLQ